MAESIVSGIALKLLNYLSQSAFEKIAPYFGGREQLNELQMTMVMIRARLSDAERRQEAEEGDVIKSWLQRLKSMLYRLEDLFEEVVMADKQEEGRHGGNFSKVVCFMPSLKLNKKVSKEAQSIMTELRSLKENMERLKLREGNVANNQYALSRISGREETYSFVREEEVYGRDEDKTMIVQMLLDSENVKENCSVVAIVGMGGLGKTTLAKLAYDDKNVQQNFELKHWACIPDQMSSFKELAEKVLQAISGNNCHQMNMEELQSKLREAVHAKKFLLVLDDVWDENHDRWHQLRSLLCDCKQGSKILVTSRSKVAVVNMGAIQPYELKGLSKEKSWELFKSIALREGQTETNPNFETIGKEITKKCGDVPLAIKTIAGLLVSKDTEEEWVHFRDKEIGMIDQEGNNIMPTLKLSYNHLPPQLKQCFAYCSLFPEDYEFDIQRLILLWVAQGFVLSQENESPYDVGHTYFLHLLRRCFFQDVSRDWLGRMEDCKMHDLMHELAKMVGDECLSVDARKSTKIGHRSNYNIRHVRHLYSANLHSLVLLKWLASPQMQSLRSYVSSYNLDETVRTSCLRRLRALDLDLLTTSLPDSIAELKHLRYLRASVKNLPKGITRLQKLETLDLRGSKDLTELPSGFRKLTTLRHLLIKHTTEFTETTPLIDMPPKFGELESLQILDTFVVGENNGLDVLSGLNLSGDLKILYKKHRQSAISEAKRANLKKKLRLTLLVLDMSVYHDEESVGDVATDNLLECLQPPSTLKSLTIQRWNGVRLPSWGMDELLGFLPNLVDIQLLKCNRCQSLPAFSRLPHLKFLRLESCDAVEYAEVRGRSSNEAVASTSSSAPSVEAYFPCLEVLRLDSMDELKGWLKIDQYCADIDRQRQHSQQLQQQFFPRLVELDIRSCPKLKSMPQVPTVGSLLNCYINPWNAPGPLEELLLENCEELDLWDVKDDDDDDDGDVSKGKRVNSSSAWKCLKSLHTLDLSYLSKLESLPSDIGGLTSLKQLSIYSLPNLKFLPESIGNLSQLYGLSIFNCDKLEALPKSFQNLTALQRLSIVNCAQLKSRCEKPDGEDWPLIQHIPSVHISGRQETRSLGCMPAFCSVRCFQD